jgi:isocitrate dehydrogenase kinase/phosphatase
MEPIQEELEAIEQAKQYIKSCSYREVAGWMKRKTGRYISAPGLRKVLARSE